MSAPSAPQPAWLQRLPGAVAGMRAPFFRYLPPKTGGRQSAVLLLFGPTAEGGQDVVLTQRSRDLRQHAGQVSFPGGAVDACDAGPRAAALREGREEVGIDPAGVDVVTELPALFLTPTRFVVTPVVGWWRQPVRIGVVDEREVSRVVRAPLDRLTDPSARFTVRHPGGYVGPGFDVDGLFVWGFTAGLLSAVLDLAGVARPWDVSVRRDLPADLLLDGRTG